MKEAGQLGPAQPDHLTGFVVEGFQRQARRASTGSGGRLLPGSPAAAAATAAAEEAAAKAAEDNEEFNDTTEEDAVNPIEGKPKTARPDLNIASED